MNLDGNLPSYEQQQEVLALAQALGVDVDTLIARIGDPTSSASNATSANTHAKLNWLLTNPKVVKSVQRGYGAIGVNSSNQSMTVSISAVTPNKCVVIINGGITTVTNQVINSPYLQVLSSNSLIIATNNALSGTNTANVSWQVIEFY